MPLSRDPLRPAEEPQALEQAQIWPGDLPQDVEVAPGAGVSADVCSAAGR